METDKQGIEEVIYSKIPRAYIISRNYIQLVIGGYSQGAFYLPPHKEETTFFMDFHSIAFRKDFEYKQEFDEM